MKEVLLTRGMIALVDDEDFEYINQWKWKAQKGRNTYYATRNVNKKGKYKTISMHRLVLSIEDKREIDHKDRDGLNNQKLNLRVCSNHENQGNKVGWGRSKYKGVSFINRGYIQAQIRINNKSVYLGLFHNEEDAARAYDRKAIEVFGEFANLNFKT